MYLSVLDKICSVVSRYAFQVMVLVYVCIVYVCMYVRMYPSVFNTVCSKQVRLSSNGFCSRMCVYVEWIRTYIHRWTDGASGSMRPRRLTVCRGEVCSQETHRCSACASWPRCVCVCVCGVYTHVCMCVCIRGISSPSQVKRKKRQGFLFLSAWSKDTQEIR